MKMSDDLATAFNDQITMEETTVETNLERVRLAGGELGAILLLDDELGAGGR